MYIERVLMDLQEHYRRLENMYQAAPINEFYKPTMEVRDSEATISIEVREDMFHAAGAAHGSVYFKLLDDAAFFAANSLELECFTVTNSFTTYLTKPIGVGKLTAEGKVVSRNKSQWIAEAVLFNEKGQEVGRGNGIFVKAGMKLQDAAGYSDSL